mgnify:FL=1
MERVQFKSRGIDVVGHIYLPDTPSKTKYPAIIGAPPFGGVKEQASGRYAKLLSSAGFIALAYDSAYFGDSFGSPRFLVDPKQEIADVEAAASYLASRDDVDSERIGALGFGAGGGWAIGAAASNISIKAVATISAVDLCDLFRSGLGGTKTKEELDAELAEAKELREREEAGEEPKWEYIVPNTLSEVKTDTQRLYKEGAEYYRTPRGLHPSADNKYLKRSVELLVGASVLDKIKRVSPRPVLLIAGEEADTLYFSKRAHELSDRHTDLEIVPGKSHFDLFDDYTVTLPKLVEFFKRI